MMLQQIIQSSGTDDGALLKNLLPQIYAADSVVNGFTFFMPYKTSDYPSGSITCDKDYFFVYSSDHWSTSEGRIVWGKGNNLDLTDFNEVQTVLQGWQIETPQLIYWPEAPDAEKWHLFCHTNRNEPGNDGEQQTRLYTSVGGGEIHEWVWTDRGRPLGLVGDEDHTGYSLIERIGDTFYAIHLTKGGLPAQYKCSTSTNLRSGWTRLYTYNLQANISANFILKPSYSFFFEAYGFKWGLITVEPNPSGLDTFAADKRLILAKVTEDFQVIEQIAVVNSEFTRMYHGYRESNIIHLYFQNPYTTQWHGTFDINNIPLLTNL